MFFACAGLVSPLVSYVVPTTRDQTFVYAGFAALAGVLLWISCDNIFLWPKPLPDMDKVLQKISFFFFFLANLSLHNAFF